MGSTKMMGYEFQLFCHGLDTDDDGFLDRLFEAGCADATVSFKDSYACLAFVRRAGSAEHAILSAIRDFGNADTGGRVERVTPEDQASLSEIARRVGVTRASLQKYARGDSKVGKDFPVPERNLSLPRRELFSTSRVMEWMRRRGKGRVTAETAELYSAIAGINKALEVQRARADENVGRLLALLAMAASCPQPVSPG